MGKSSESSIRQSTFTVLLVAFMSALLVVSSFNFDLALFAYVVGIISAFVTFSVMIYFAVRSRRASDMYWLVLCLIASICYALVWQVYGRHTYLTCNDDYDSLASGFWWKTRNVPEIVAFLYLNAWTRGRIITSKRDRRIDG
jgi:fluoride ion exporter CrcB/FEX